MGILQKKDLKYYLNLNYPITIEKYTEYDGREYFAAEIPDLPGCGAEGKTVDEALKKLEEAKKAWIEVSLERGLEIPEPATEDQFSGKFLLRIPAKLHRQLALKAKRASVSLNQYVRSILERVPYEDQIISRFQRLEERIEYLEEATQEIKTYLREILEQHSAPLRMRARDIFGETWQLIRQPFLVSTRQISRMSDEQTSQNEPFEEEFTGEEYRERISI